MFVEGRFRHRTDLGGKVSREGMTDPHPQTGAVWYGFLRHRHLVLLGVGGYLLRGLWRRRAAAACPLLRGRPWQPGNRDILRPRSAPRHHQALHLWPWMRREVVYWYASVCLCACFFVYLCAQRFFDLLELKFLFLNSVRQKKKKRNNFH